MGLSVQRGEQAGGKREWAKDPCYCIYPPCKRIARLRFVCVCLLGLCSAMPAGVEVSIDSVVL